ncbi:hypothetical protein ACOMHN_027843 [Nucella lapillus]
MSSFLTAVWYPVRKTPSSKPANQTRSRRRRADNARSDAAIPADKGHNRGKNHNGGYGPSGVRRCSIRRPSKTSKAASPISSLQHAVPQSGRLISCLEYHASLCHRFDLRLPEGRNCLGE